MIRIRGGSGLGDSLYVRPVAEQFVRAGRQVTVMSDYPEVFSGAALRVEPFTRSGCNKIAHYSIRRNCPETNQWQDICISAGVENLALSFRWEIKNTLLTRDLLAMAAGKPVVMVNGGRPPMGRADGYAREMLPTRDAFDAALLALEDCFTVEVGKGNEIYPLSADVDLADRTSPADLLDIASISAGLVGQCSFMIPLAEALDKPLLVVWAAQGLISGTEFIRQCTPQKILSKASSRYVMDNWPVEKIEEVAHEFRQSFASR